MSLRPATARILPLLLLLVGAATMPEATGISVARAQQTGPGFTPIYEIQGSGRTSPLAGARVDAAGVVTGLTRDGFYLQDPVGDGDPLTSDGVYVYTYRPPETTSRAVQSGACVAVRDALVQEYYGKTELSRVGNVEASTACGSDTIAPVALPELRLGADVEELYERFEGMAVKTDGLSGIVHGPTKRYASGEAEIAFLPDDLQPAVDYGRILRSAEDADSSADAPWAGHSLQYLSNLLGGDLPAANWGDRIRSGQDGTETVRAVLDYNFGKYQLLLLPGQPVTVDAAPPAIEEGLAASADEFTVCTFNVHGLGRGEAQYTDRQDYDRAVTRAAEAIAGPMQGCTIVALQETGAKADANALAEALATHQRLHYEVVAVDGPMSGDAEFPLTNSFLVRADRAHVVRYDGVQGCSPHDYGVLEVEGEQCLPGEFPLFNRPPLVMDVLVEGEWGDPFALRLVNNHWKSKAGDEETNAKRRLLQAAHVAQIVNASHADDGVENVIVIGDLNDFAGSAPLLQLTAASAENAFPLLDIWQLLPAERPVLLYLQRHQPSSRPYSHLAEYGTILFRRGRTPFQCRFRHVRAGVGARTVPDERPRSVDDSTPSRWRGLGGRRLGFPRC